MKKYKVMVTDWEYPNLQYEELILKHPDIEFIPVQCKTEEEVIQVCKEAHGLLNQYAPITRKVIESLPNCQVIARYGVGVNTVDLEAATENGICVANVPDYCMDEVSDHALALLLSFARKIVVGDRFVKHGVWDYKVTMPINRLRGQTIGFVGFGKIAQVLAEKVKPLGLKPIAFDPYLPSAVAEEKGVTLVSLDELCENADFISVHAPLMESTEGLIGKNQFEKMKENALLINTSRGPVVDEEALIAALQNKRISGAALDVICEEPIASNHPFLAMDNVILTPHVAWYSEESTAELRTKVAQNVYDVLIRGQYPKYLVNAKVKNKTKLIEEKGVEISL